MERGKLRQLVAVHLGSIGYAHGSYGWARSGHRVVLRILTTPDAKLSKAGGDLSASCYFDLHLPARQITGKRKLAAALAAVPTIGTPKAVKAWIEPVSAVQGALI